MGKNDSIYERVTNSLAAILTIDPPSREFNLIESGYLDSLGLVDLLLEIEQEYNVELSMEDLELDSFRSVESIVELIRSQNGYQHVIG